MLNKLKNFLKAKVPTFKKLVVPVGVFVCLLVATSVAQAVTAEQLIQTILDVIFTVARYIGIILLAWGAFVLVMALKNEDADSKSRAVLLMIVAVALVTLSFLFKPLLTLLGFTANSNVG